MRQQLPWKVLPLVLLGITLLALPGILLRHNGRQAAQEAAKPVDIRQTIIDAALTNGNGLTPDDAACVADTLIGVHGGEQATLEKYNRSEQLFTTTAYGYIREQCDLAVN